MLGRTDDMAGETLESAVSYSRPSAFREYAKRIENMLASALKNKFGEGALKDQRFIDFMEDLKFSGRVESQKIFLESIDSPVIERLGTAFKFDPIKSMVERTARDAKSVSRGQQYLKEMASFLGIDRTAELAAHGTMSRASMLPALAEDASVAASSVLDAAKIASTTIERPVDRIMFDAGRRPLGRAITTAGRSSTTSKIISGVQTAMKVAGIVK